MLVAARALATEGGKPSIVDIATRTGLSPIAVRRALRLGRGAAG